MLLIFYSRLVIAGLEFLAEDGNQDAIDTIEGLKLLI